MQTIGQGPDLGLCANPPEEVHGFGEVGIGSCLAGPTDLTFVERDQQDWLVVSNADPFINFDSGSVLLVDWSSVEAGMAAGQQELYLNELDTEVILTDRFIGALGVAQNGTQLLVANRFTEDGRTRAGEDRALVYDVATLEPSEIRSSVPLRDDPGDFVVDDLTNRVYALNYTDHSVSVIDSSDGLEMIDLAPEAQMTELPFDDADGSGSVAEFDRMIIGTPTDVPSDAWTLTWLPGTIRLFAPDGDVLNRFSSGGGTYLPDPLGSNVDLNPPILDPVVALPALTSEQDATVSGVGLYFASEGAIWVTQNEDDVDGWATAIPVLGGLDGTWQAGLSGPSLSVVGGFPALFFAGEGDDPNVRSIGMAVANDAGSFVRPEDPVLLAPAGESYEQPFAQLDERRLSGRVWFSHFDGSKYQISLSSFDDLDKNAVTFAPVRSVLAVDDRSIAAPVVRYVDGSYRLWASRDDGTQWTYVTSSSADGVHWGPLTDLFASDSPYDPRMPPRVAVQHESRSYWRIAARDLGTLTQPAVSGLRLVDLQNGFSYTVASGHEASSDELFPLGRASSGLVPTSLVEVDGASWTYVTISGDDGRDRIAVLDNDHPLGRWDVREQDLIPQGTGGNVLGVSDPVVVRPDPAGPFVMFYTAQTAAGLTRIRAATSDDGEFFTPVGQNLLDELVLPWASSEQEAHSVETRPDGSTWLWMAGNDGSRWRIGAIRVDGLSTPDTATYTVEPLEFTDFQLASGLPGGADDSGVKDPVITVIDGERVMYYSGFDGTRWSLCRATFAGEDWRRRLHRDTDVTLPALSATSGTFTTGGVDSPVLFGDGEMLYAGYDSTEGSETIARLGRALIDGPTIYAAFRQPTAGDTLMFETQRGDEETSVIELEQRTSTFFNTGTGTTSMVLDSDAGMLYVPSKLTNFLYVLDIRADVRPGSPDANALDLETVVRFDTVQNSAGFRGAALDSARDRMYVTTRSPDGIAVLDLSAVVDDDDKEVTYGGFMGTLALQDDQQDRGSESVAPIGGAEPLLVGDLLIVPNFNDNSVSVFDVTIGAFGAEIAHIPWVGENPHIAAASPDGNWVVIANYLGELDGDVASSTLALLDIDPTSPTYLTVPHWIKNR